MAKRFTDTEIWNDPWYRKLSLEAKVFWKYLVDQCDIAGFWKKDYDLASFNCGFEVTDKTIEEINHGKLRVKDHKGHLEITQFIEFQQKTTELNPNNKAHLGILTLLKKYGSSYGYSMNSEDSIKGASKGLTSPTGIGIGNGIGKKRGEGEKISFERFWPLYPHKVDKQRAEILWNKLSKADQSLVLEDIPLRIKSPPWIREGGKYIPMPSTYLRNKRWLDELPANVPNMSSLKLGKAKTHDSHN